MVWYIQTSPYTSTSATMPTACSGNYPIFGPTLSATTAATTTITASTYGWVAVDDGTAGGTQVYWSNNTTPITEQWVPCAPTIIRPMRRPPQMTQEEVARREAARAQQEQEDYQHALARHDEQEAARIMRMIAAREQLVAERAARDLEMQQQRQQDAQASQRARELLLEHLTSQQREAFDRNGWFIVEGGRTKTKYRINCGRIAGNIDVLDKIFGIERVSHRLCAHAAHSAMPHHDHLLAQKLMLEHSEDDFLRIANRH